MRNALWVALVVVWAGACTSIVGDFDDNGTGTTGTGGATSSSATSVTSTASSSSATSSGQSGSPCASAAECVSGFCVDGVCCGTACANACMACAAKAQEPGGGGDGTCSPAANGKPDPRTLCPIEVKTSCGQDGDCHDGGCEKWPAGTPCAPSSCMPGQGNGAAASFTAATTCDGDGACDQGGATTSCVAYTGCAGDGTTCAATCSGNAQCATSHQCAGGSCVGQKGAPCTTGDQCLTGFCADGVCCNAACAGPCVACGTDGICDHVADGQPSPAGHPQCAAQPMSTCGLDGLCTQGACASWPAGTPCGPVSCTAGVQDALLCGNQGTCQPKTVAMCGNYVCDAAGTACNTSCSSSSECASGHVCTAGQCH